MKRIAAILLLLIAGPARAEPGVVVVMVHGVRSNAGHVLVAICDRDTFLDPTCKYVGRAPATIGTVVVRVSGVPAGTYAAQAFQDENDNKKIDRNFLGIPKEGLGFSNDARIRFGPPSFADAAFRLSEAGGSIEFPLHYFD